MRKTYPSDVTREQFENIRSVLESVRKKTHPRTTRQESRRRGRGARDSRASSGRSRRASRRKVIVGAVSHRVVVQRCGRRTNRGVITCRVMRVHFGVTMAEMHHEHSDTPKKL